MRTRQNWQAQETVKPDDMNAIGEDLQILDERLVIVAHTAEKAKEIALDAKIEISKIDLTKYVRQNEVLTKTNMIEFTPIEDFHPTTKKYVDETAGGGAPINSPQFTGMPTAPTATAGTNTAQIATTAFVLANAGSGAQGKNPPFDSLYYRTGLKLTWTSTTTNVTETITIVSGNLILATQTTSFSGTTATITTQFYARTFALDGISVTTTAYTDTATITL